MQIIYDWQQFEQKKKINSMSRSLVLTLHVPTAKIGKPVNRVNEKKKGFQERNSGWTVEPINFYINLPFLFR